MATAEELKLVMRAETAAAVKDLKKAASEIKKTRDSTKSLADAFKDQMSKSLSAKNALLQLTSSVAGGMAVYNLASKGFRALAGFVNDSSEAYRRQAAAERALEAAALNNPYLDGESVASLKAYSAELQKLTNTDDALAIKTMASLESLQLTEDQIKAVMTAAADYAAVTGKDLGSAAQQLAITYSGTIGALGRMIPALKNLSKEQLAAGGAIEVFTKQYGGMAAAMAETDEGQIARLANAWGDFKEQVGRDADKAFGPLRRSLADYLEKLTEAMSKTREVGEAESAVAAGSASTEQKLLAATAALEKRRALVKAMEKNGGALYIAEKAALDELEPKQLAYIEALTEELDLERSLEKAIADATRAREDATGAEEAAASAWEERNKAAADHYKATLDAYNETIAKMELEARIRGESVTAQDRLNAAQKAYFDLFAGSKGTITEQGPSAAAFRSAVDLEGLSGSAEQEASADRIAGILGKAKQAVEEYGLSQVDLNFIALENAGATMEQISAYAKYAADLERLENQTKDSENIVESMTESLKAQAQSMAAGGLADMFAGMGEAMASNADVGAAAAAAVKNFAVDCLRQASSLALTAGLRVLVEQGTAGLPLALALFAAGGVAGIAGGYLGGGASGGSTGTLVDPVDYKKYISDPIVDAEKDNSQRRIELLKEQLKEEKKLRDEHIDKLEDEFDQEFAVLKDLWDRNIISTEEYKSRSAALRDEKYAAVYAVDQDYTAQETEANRLIEAEQFAQKKSEALTDLYLKLNELQANASSLKGKSFLKPFGDDDYLSPIDAALKEIAKLNYSIEAFESSQSQEELNRLLWPIEGKVNSGQGIENARSERIRMLTEEQQIYAGAAAEETDGIYKAIYEELADKFDKRIEKATAAKTMQDIIAAREGADFVTSGPRMLLVGDNATGRERVQVTPLGSPNLRGPRAGEEFGGGQTINIYLTGEVYGVEDLYARLNAAGKALARKGRL